MEQIISIFLQAHLLLRRVWDHPFEKGFNELWTDKLKFKYNRGYVSKQLTALLAMHPFLVPALGLSDWDK